MEQSNTELLGYLSVINDPRLDRKKLHQLTDVLFLAVCASLCGCDTREDIHEFGEIRQAWLKQYIPLANGIASSDTIARVFSLIDPHEFERAFRQWVSSLYKIGEDGWIIAIDGKRIRGSHGEGKSAIHMVGAFATEAGLALAQVKTADKSNEITAIPELLEALILKDCVVTLDAMGCQKDIVKKIKEKQGNYVISLKGSQGDLHEDVRSFLEAQRLKGFQSLAHSYYETIEKGHGRVETRRYWITDQIDWLADKEQWAGLRSIGLVESERYVKGETAKEHVILSALSKQMVNASRQQ